MLNAAYEKALAEQAGYNHAGAAARRTCVLFQDGEGH
jgi:hypothetical protein